MLYSDLKQNNWIDALNIQWTDNDYAVLRTNATASQHMTDEDKQCWNNTALTSCQPIINGGSSYTGFKLMYRDAGDRIQFELYVIMLGGTDCRHNNNNKFYLSLNNEVKLNGASNGFQISNAVFGTVLQIGTTWEVSKSAIINDKIPIKFKWCNPYYIGNSGANSQVANMSLQYVYSISYYDNEIADYTYNKELDIAVIPTNLVITTDGVEVDDFVSYGQEIEVSGYNKIKLVGANVPDWESWENAPANYNLFNIYPADIGGYPDTLIVYGSRTGG